MACNVTWMRSIVVNRLSCLVGFLLCRWAIHSFMNPLSGLGIVAGDMDSLDFHEIEQPSAIGKLRHIAGWPNGSFRISDVHGESQLRARNTSLQGIMVHPTRIFWQ